MKDKLILKLDERKLVGRKVKQLRRQGIIPGNIFGKKTNSTSFQVLEKDFQKIYSQAGETSIIYVTFNGEEQPRPVLVSALQIHPVTSDILHVDFHQVDLSQKVTATVPLVLEGVSPAVDEKGAVLVQHMNELEVEALPTDLPHELMVDISSLKEIGDSIIVKDIKVDTAKIEIKADSEEPIVQAQEPQKEEETVVVESEAETAETSKEASSTEQKAE